MPFDHHLGDAISNRRDPQRAHPAIALRYVDPPHRWRKVAARRQTIPKFIEVVFKISLKIRNHLAVYASRPWLALTRPARVLQVRCGRPGRGLSKRPDPR